ncbi:UNVERIFIED_CONTAM: hypothetical protein FKN15_025234 [Acipenser sinensis]
MDGTTTTNKDIPSETVVEMDPETDSMESEGDDEADHQGKLGPASLLDQSSSCQYPTRVRRCPGRFCCSTQPCPGGPMREELLAHGRKLWGEWKNESKAMSLYQKQRDQRRGHLSRTGGGCNKGIVYLS